MITVHACAMIIGHVSTQFSGEVRRAKPPGKAGEFGGPRRLPRRKMVGGVGQGWVDITWLDFAGYILLARKRLDLLRIRFAEVQCGSDSAQIRIGFGAV